MNELHGFKIKRDELSDLFGQGIPKGSIVLMEGPYGTGKSVMCQRMTYGFLENGHSVTYITTEQTVKGFIDQMYSLDYPIAPALLSANLLLIPVYPLVGSMKTRKDFLNQFMNASQLFQNDILVVDTLSSLMYNSLDAEQKAIELLGILKRLSAMNKTTIVTIESGVLKDDVLAPFRASASVYTEFELKDFGGIQSRAMRVTRFLNTEQLVNDNIGFKVIPKVGIVIEITTVG